MQVQLQEIHTNRKHPSNTLKKLASLHIYKLHVIRIAKLPRYLAMSITQQLMNYLAYIR